MTTPFRLTSITISCTDLARSARFYEDVLGAVLDPRDGVGCRWYRLGSAWISLMPNSFRPSPSQMPDDAMAMLWLETNDLAAAERRFEEFHVTVLQPSDGQFMLITDPDGIVIEVWQSTGSDSDQEIT
jgi:catechol 2,3-dioxygenase-like lactoylglutathione lyase family enzyme